MKSQEELEGIRTILVELVTWLNETVSRLNTLIIEVDRQHLTGKAQNSQET